MPLLQDWWNGALGAAERSHPILFVIGLSIVFGALLTFCCKRCCRKNDRPIYIQVQPPYYGAIQDPDIVKSPDISPRPTLKGF